MSGMCALEKCTAPVAGASIHLSNATQRLSYCVLCLSGTTHVPRAASSMDALPWNCARGCAHRAGGVIHPGVRCYT